MSGSKNDKLGQAVQWLVGWPEHLGLILDLMSKMHNESFRFALKRFLRNEDPWPVGPVLLNEIKLPRIGRFLSRENLPRKGRQIYYADYFEAAFLADDGVFCEATWGSTLRVHRLGQLVSLDELIAHLGGEKSAEVRLSELCHLLVNQIDGDEGPLSLRNTNVALVRGVDLRLHPIGLRFGSGRWYVSAYDGHLYCSGNLGENDLLFAGRLSR